MHVVRARTRAPFQTSTHRVLEQELRRLRARVATLESENLRLHELAQVDELTALANRRGFFIAIDKLGADISRHGGAAAILAIDLDGFKRLNDTRGHAAGDAALKDVAAAITRSIRGADTAARLGGDEFAVLLPRAGLAEGTVVAERIRHAVAELPVELRASVGVSCWSGSGGSTGVDALRRADIALYAAKRKGGDRVTLLPEERQPE